MKFHPPLCVVANSGFEKPICDHVIASKSCSSVLDTGDHIADTSVWYWMCTELVSHPFPQFCLRYRRSYPRYLSLVPNVHRIGIPCLPGTLITYFFVTYHLKNPVAWNRIFTTCFSGLGIYRERHWVLQGLLKTIIHVSSGSRANTGVTGGFCLQPCPVVVGRIQKLLPHPISHPFLYD